MEYRKGTPFIIQKRPAFPVRAFYSLLSISILAVGCGAPGEPVPPTPPVPQGITDLAAKQAGDGVLLTFTLPGKSTLGENLPQTPAFEVWRGGQQPDGSADDKSFRLVDTVPGPMVARYAQHGQIHFVDAVAPQDPQFLAGQPLVFRVRTYISAKHPSANSPAVPVRLYPVPEPITSLEVKVTEQGIELKWTPPTRTSSGEPLSGVKEYHVFRGELNPASASIPAAERAQGVWKTPPAQLGVTQTPDYRDSGFDYGKTYAYLVRSVVDSPAGLLESDDSSQAVVTPKDIFPPAAPQGIVAAVEPGAAPGTVVVDLTWSINVEPDLAGYRVYRSETQGEKGALLTPDLLPSPEYRDNSVQSGHHYWYSVSAVDRSGNESAPSPAAAVDVAQPSR